MKHGLVFESTDDMTERVHVFQFAEPLLTWFRFLGWSRRERAFNLGVFRFFRLVEGNQLIDARIGHLDHADGVIPRAAGQLLIRNSGHQGEQGLLANLRQTNQRDFHESPTR
jgi:hypothetical protein